MIWVLRIIFVVIYLVLFDLIVGLIGFCLSRFSFQRHPWLHRFGIGLIALTYFVHGKLLPKCCKIPCFGDCCRNWTCPNYHTHPEEAPGSVVDSEAGS